MEIAQFLREHGIFPKIIAEILALDYSDDDLRAMLNWCADQLRGMDNAAQLIPGRFVSRVRGGVAAPEKYYQPPCEVCGEFGGHKASCSRRYAGGEEFIARERERIAREQEAEAEAEKEAEEQFLAVPPEIQQAWQEVLKRLKEDLPRASFETWVQSTRVIGLEQNRLEVLTRNTYAQEWLARRLTDTVNRLLPGLLHNPPAVVAFVAPHSQAEEDDDE